MMSVVPYYIRFDELDRENAVALGTVDLQQRLRDHLEVQNREWPEAQRYTHGYFYQGLEDIGITGAKPTGFRFAQYDVDNILADADVLDIGSNCGFVSIYCARRSHSVIGVELNPYLNNIAKDTADYFKLRNLEIVEKDFVHYESNQKFNVVLSLSNHHTIDGNLSMDFEKYILKIKAMLRVDGYLLFESHNVFAPGVGNVGDDGDFDNKMKIVNKYFTIERYKMVRCYLKHNVEDLDKLFFVARSVDSPVRTDFQLATAITKYCY